MREAPGSEMPGAPFDRQAIYLIQVEELLDFAQVRAEEVMTKVELNRYKALLEAKQAELVKGLRNREGITIQKSADTMDEIQLARERELVVSNLDRESNLLRDVRSAL